MLQLAAAPGRCRPRVSRVIPAMNQRPSVDEVCIGIRDGEPRPHSECVAVPDVQCLLGHADAARSVLPRGPDAGIRVTQLTVRLTDRRRLADFGPFQAELEEGELRAALRGAERPRSDSQHEQRRRS